jgi:hypothetical protein
MVQAQQRIGVGGIVHEFSVALGELLPPVLVFVLIK